MSPAASSGTACAPEAPARSAPSLGEAVRAHVQLMRPANMITAAADVLAGFAAAGMSGGARLPWLLAATMALYGGGVVCNDFFDRKLDAVERPERPIPSGRATPRGAGLLAAFLLACGVACGFQASAASGVIACLIAVCAVAYDARAKHSAWAGPLLMGSCRALNLLLGVSAAAMLSARWYIAPVSLIYVAGITVLSAGEVHGGSRLRALLSASLFGAAVAGVLALGFTPGFRVETAIAFLLFLGWRAGPAVYRACRKPEAARIRRAVGAAVIALVFIDSAIAGGYAGSAYAMGLVALVFLVSWLGRKFPVT